MHIIKDNGYRCSCTVCVKAWPIADLTIQLAVSDARIADLTAAIEMKEKLLLRCKLIVEKRSCRTNLL